MGMLFSEQTEQTWFTLFVVSVSSDSWAKLKSRSSLSIVSVIHICCICHAVLANPRIQCICNIHGEVRTWQMPASAAAVTAGTLCICGACLFRPPPESLWAVWALKNVPVPQQTWQYKWLVKQCNIVHKTYETKFHIKFHSIKGREPPIVQTVKNQWLTPQTLIWTCDQNVSLTWMFSFHTL